MLRPIASIAFAVLLVSCVNTPATEDDGSSGVRLGEPVNLGGPIVTVVKVLEDSRCPSEVDCAWPGQVKVSVRIELGSGTRTAELTTIQPVPFADGQLELTSVLPIRSSQRAILPEDYKFTLKFNGGL